MRTQPMSVKNSGHTGTSTAVGGESETFQDARRRKRQAHGAASNKVADRCLMHSHYTRQRWAASGAATRTSRTWHFAAGYYGSLLTLHFI